MKIFNRIWVIIFMNALVCTPYFTFSCVNDIKQIHSYTQVADILDNADENTLILFDVDYTLFVPENNLCWYKTKDWQRNKERYQQWLPELLEQIFKKMKKPELYYKSLWHAKETPLLIEPTIVHTIKSLQNRKIKVLALTAITSGQYSTINSLPVWRFHKLKQLDIDFTPAHFDNMIFDELVHEDGYHPALYNGILCTSPDSKANVLGSFLNRIPYTPSRIIFFDDSLSHIEGVAQEMKKRSIPFQGYEYLGAYSMPITLDKEITTLRLHHLVEHEEWLSEEEARALLTQQK